MPLLHFRIMAARYALRHARSAAIVLLVLFTSSLCHAEVSPEYQKFGDLLFSLDEQLRTLFDQEQSMAAVDTVFTAQCLDEDGDEPVLEPRILREQAVTARRRRGLELRGLYATGDITDETSDGGGIQNGSANLELSWEVFNNGYRQYGKQADALEYRARIEEIRQELLRQERESRCRRYSLHQSFSESLTYLLQMKLRLMESVFPVERRAYFKHWSYLDDYFVSEEDLLLTRRDLADLHLEASSETTPVSLFVPPLIDVDLPGMVEAIRSDNRPEMMTDLEKERLETEQSADIPDSLRFFVRQEFDLNSQRTGGNDLITGLRFRIPLYNRTTDELKYRLLQAERNEARMLRQRVAKTRAAHTELKEQLRRTIRQYYRQVRARERARRTLLQLETDAERHMTVAITRMRTVIEATIELVRAKEELYRRVNEMFLVAGLPYRSDLVRKINLSPNLARARLGERSLYVWSTGFNALANEDLVHFLNTKQITRVLLSTGKSISLGKIRDFLELGKARNITVELITGSTSWILPENQDTAVARALIVAEQTGSIHLDIEPHTLADFREKKDEYLALYIELLEKIRQGLLDHRLSVAIPVHYPAEIYTQLNTLSDRVYVMAYGTTDSEVVTRRLQTILAGIDHDKVVIVLRASDFRDEWGLEKMIDSLTTRTGITRYGIHQLTTFLKKSTDEHETPDPEELF